MKKLLFRMSLAILVVIGALNLSIEEVHAQTATRFDPCICYTYFSDGHIETGQSCDHPNARGACSRLVPCLPKNKEDQ